MPNFIAKIQRDFEVTVEADSAASADKIARQILGQFPEGTVKLLSILPEGYVEPATEEPKPPFGGKPGPSGGTPGAGTATREILVDQIAA